MLPVIWWTVSREQMVICGHVNGIICHYGNVKNNGKRSDLLTPFPPLFSFKKQTTNWALKRATLSEMEIILLFAIRDVLL